MYGIKKKNRYIEKILKKADKTIDEGIKKADEILDETVEFGGLAANQAKKTGRELRLKAKEEGKSLKMKGISKFNGVSAARKFTVNTEKDLRSLEKLAELKKTGVITDKEFKEKKKKILHRI